MNEQQVTFWCTGYLANGVKVSFTVPTAADGAAAYQHALAFTAALLAAGFSVNEPGLEAGEESETIVTVMRREKSDGTPIIDFFPAWREGGDEPFGTYKYLHKYLNDGDEIAAFLSVAGFKSLNDIPLYDGQSPLKRTPGKRHAKETAVPTPFKVVRKQGVEKTGSDGKPYRPWELVRYEATGAPAAQPPTTQPPAGEPPLTVVSARELIASLVETREYTKQDGSKGKKVVYHCAGNVKAGDWSTKRAAAAGYDVSAWGELGMHDLTPPALVAVEADGQYWKVAGIKKTDALGATGTDDMDFLA